VVWFGCTDLKACCGKGKTGCTVNQSKGRRKKKGTGRQLQLKKGHSAFYSVTHEAGKESRKNNLGEAQIEKRKRERAAEAKKGVSKVVPCKGGSHS